jgi:hypothetical protein
MKKLLMATALLCIGTLAMAGPNAGGTLIIALSEGTVYSGDDAPYCWNTVDVCQNAVVRVDTQAIVVMNVIAAFDPAASPRLAGVTFGIAYGDDVFLVNLGPCGDFELPDGAWPASGSGNGVTWGAAQTGFLTDVYWFAAYDYYGVPDSFCLIANPAQGADFADDDIPANLDGILPLEENDPNNPYDDLLSCFGFYQDGGLICPSPDVPGACCPGDGSCTLLFEGDCIAMGWLWIGGPCEPNPCPPPPIRACCFDEVCELLTEALCAQLGGVWLPEEEACDPNPCISTPTIDSTWGQIKANYR